MQYDTMRCDAMKRYLVSLGQFELKWHLNDNGCLLSELMFPAHHSIFPPYNTALHLLVVSGFWVGYLADSVGWFGGERARVQIAIRYEYVQSCHARPNIDATSPVDCECIMPLESLLANFKLLAVDSFLAAYKRCNEYGCWMSCCELLTAACATALATLSMSVVEAVKPLYCNEQTDDFPMSKQNGDF